MAPPLNSRDNTGLASVLKYDYQHICQGERTKFDRFVDPNVRAEYI